MRRVRCHECDKEFLHLLTHKPADPIHCETCMRAKSRNLKKFTLDPQKDLSASRSMQYGFTAGTVMFYCVHSLRNCSVVLPFCLGPSVLFAMEKILKLVFIALCGVIEYIYFYYLFMILRIGGLKFIIHSKTIKRWPVFSFCFSTWWPMRRL